MRARAHRRLAAASRLRHAAWSGRPGCGWESPGRHRPAHSSPGRPHRPMELSSRRDGASVAAWIGSAGVRTGLSGAWYTGHHPVGHRRPDLATAGWFAATYPDVSAADLAWLGSTSLCPPLLRMLRKNRDRRGAFGRSRGCGGHRRPGPARRVGSLGRRVGERLGARVHAARLDPLPRV